MSEENLGLKSIVEKFRKNWKKKDGETLSLDKCANINEVYFEACKKAYAPSVLRALKFEDISDDKKDKLKMESFDYLNNQLNKLFHHTPNLNFSRFDTWEQETVNHIVKIYTNGGVGDYTYGNGQKLVNMAIKFILSSDLIDYNHDVFKYCHIPVDGIIQKIAKKGLDVNWLYKNGKEVNSYSSWSKNNLRTDFLNYQECIRKATQEKGYYSPLIWEIQNWKP